MSHSKGAEASLSTKSPKNHLIPRALSNEIIDDWGMAADNSHERKMSNN
ncbi:MAG: hypothetical protein PUD23_09870 [Prevotella sp.]|nr:hypothetical protein [Hallella absiana]MDD5822339.1 hypothetical protein [Prevotella sp.]